ncbi:MULTISPECIES: acyl-CoA dehydrogenase family protein [Streptomyces]|uniref:acyl-CoA dehydrogenase family protein n=1 Tax=Streptomyces TaxID=1883 RepID=UPI000241AE53|nr:MULTISPECIES: acyl-CoA dehydrogenase family protein [Streptomyces]EHM28689.1 isovaleryl-CoA dehydrogenase [Streptomyces sp. W007]MCX4483274.1 acyl-CoA/acyl-ACP dehydrogenase [Streptomyces anulatus]MCX4505775.1 acyl-CoA/acyl-ACP dehydrogenase [Streptomyces anulatus]MCX4516945.1 acyl-CoA/acyl-ACP dehydrogenase [Streptomyces anulatus]MCX4599775.1 acyl-CoA/acyl-ACP dehydrogenase [Streptomyces anulatus]
MDMTWTDRQDELRRRFTAFGRERVAPDSDRRDREEAFELPLWQELADAGFWAVHVPKRYGGDGGDLWDHVAAFEGLARGARDCGFVLSAAAHAGLQQLLLRYGTEEQKEALLPGLVSGRIGATAATEAAGGSHVSAVTTSARPKPGGGGYLLSGQKSHITNAPVADLMMVVGRVAGIGPRDITLFLVEKGQPGVEQGAQESLLGLRTSPMGPIVLDDVEITPERVLGGIGSGLDVLYWCLAFDRMIYGIVVSAHLESLLPTAIERITTRKAFGSPIGEHQYIQDKVVDMQMTVTASRALSYATVGALVGTDDTDRASLLASCVKLLSAEGLVRAGLELVQIFGHLGFESGSGIERQLRDAVAFRIAGGTNEMQKKNIFNQVLRAHGGGAGL